MLGARSEAPTASRVLTNIARRRPRVTLYALVMGLAAACSDRSGTPETRCADEARCTGEACTCAPPESEAEGQPRAETETETETRSTPVTEAPGRYGDGVRNGTETDVDCGGGAAPRCSAGKACLNHADCESAGCTLFGTCAHRASCTQLAGGQTCGPEDSLERQRDCCEDAAVGSSRVDRYLVTAGRMRAFLARVDGHVRDWAAKLPADRWDQAYTPMLPNTIDGPADDGNSAHTQLGPWWHKRSCETGYHTGHTYWTPPAYGDEKDFSQAVLDTKALNCVPWWLLAALCAFDGGHLATEAELRAAFTNGGTTAYPWGSRGDYRADAWSDRAVQEFSYETNAPARRDAWGFLDVAANIAPPGRRPRGNSATGHADLVGNLLEWVGDAQGRFVWKGSFERHAAEADRLAPPVDEQPYMAVKPDGAPWLWQEVAAPDQNPNGYYAIGGRCAH